MASAGDQFDPYTQWLGLSPSAAPYDHYALLGLETFETEPARIERQADERLRLVRSYQTGPRGRFTQKLLNELTAAKLCLLSPAAKEAYDERLRSDRAAAVSAAFSPHADETSHLSPAASPSETLASSLVLPPPISLEPPLLPPPVQPVAPPRSLDDDSTEAEGPEESSGVSMPMVLVGLVLGLMGVSVTIWTLTSFAMHQGWLAGGPQRGGPPASMIAKTPPRVRNATSSDEGSGAQDSAGLGIVAEPGDDEAPEVLQEASGEVALSPGTALPEGEVSTELDGKDEVLTGWSSRDDAAHWRFRIVRPAFFEVQIIYAASEENFGRRIELVVDGEQGGQAKVLELQPTTDGFRTDLLTIAVTKSGAHDFSVRPTGPLYGDLRIKLIRLKPVGGG